MSTRPRWFTDTSEGHSQWYIERFRTMAAQGADLAGEARLIDAMVPPGSRILDAGCGPGRIAAELQARGHHAVGVDVDPELIAAAEIDHPGPVWVTADLATFDLGFTERDYQPFEIAVIAGNVMVFVGPGTEQQVLARVAAHVRPGGRIVVGCATDREYSLAAFDADLVAAGLSVQHRFATWDLQPLAPDSTFAVTVLRVPVAG
jgi:2-polyprenyl-3-methyl-5-hydroxy-6-metoxy-1,4-benzoquinol methylase